MKPPKCKSCGKEEWRHICGTMPKTHRKVRSVTDRLEAAIPDMVITTKPSRKEYLKLKARERRARQRAVRLA
jgi:hypothetical protein